MSNWAALGSGTKDSKGEWLEMFFDEKNIFENADVRIDPEVGLEYVTVND